MRLGTAGIRCHGHYRDTVGLGSAGILCCWALQGYLLGAAKKLCLRLGAAGMFCGAALQGYYAVGH